nr:autotransporter outer membrane beta-barrel domain-containing protein [Bradyrhizobium aeschynomenes]
MSQSGFAGANRFITSVFDAAFGDPGGAAGPGGTAPLGYAPDRKASRAAQEAYAAVTPRDAGASFEARWNVWAAGYDGNARIGGDTAAGSHATASRVSGVVAGAGVQLSPLTRIGFALGGAGSSAALDGGFGTSRADMFNAALYGRHDFGASYVAGLIGYSWQQASTDRTVTVAGTDVLHAAFHPQALSARLETGRRFGAPSFAVVPYAAVQTTAFFLPTYAETATSGSNQFALSYAARSATTTRSELGLRVSSDHAATAGLLTLRGRLAWAHDSFSGQGANATFQTLPGATFTVFGAQGAPDAALASIGADYRFGRGWSVGAHLDSEFSRTTTSYAAKAAARYSW